MRELLSGGQLAKFACVIGLLASVVSFSTFGQEDTLSAEVRAREIAFAKTMADRDLEAFASFVSPEAIFFSGDNPLRGRAAVVAAWARFYEGPDAPFSWSPDLVQVLDSGQLGLSSGPVLGPAGEDFGRFNSIWRRNADGEWLVVFDKGS
jgi:ketosteroid isomerase-like protein